MPRIEHPGKEGGEKKNEKCSEMFLEQDLVARKWSKLILRKVKNRWFPFTFERRRGVTWKERRKEGKKEKRKRKKGEGEKKKDQEASLLTTLSIMFARA